MSGYVPKRVRTERTAMGSTDANSSGKNGHSIVSTIGRRSTLLNKIQSRSFGSMWQINYLNAAGNKCERERLVPVREKYNNLTLTQNIDYTLTIFNSKNTTKSFMNSVLYMAQYYIQTENSDSVNYNTAQFPTGSFLSKRPFMWINYAWLIMPCYVLSTLW